MIIGVLLLAVIALIVAVTLFDLLFRPTFRRIAIRNISRRKGEAVLVVFGSLLGTAIITSSFVVGDTLDASLRDNARVRLGPIDQTVRVVGLEALPEVEQALARPIADTDGVVSFVTAGATVATVGDDRRAEPSAGILEIDFEAARRFGADPVATGLADAGATPGEGEIVLGHQLAETLEAGPGDAVEIFAYGRSTELVVREVVDGKGFAGHVGGGRSRPATGLVAPGTIAALAASADPEASAAPPRGFVAVSNDGDVFGGVGLSAAVTAEMERRVAGIAGAEVQPVKQDMVAEARREGESFTQLFAGIGGFSVIAGILLLVNIFVMLSEERKTELGMMRAVGLKRNHLVRSFGLEGAMYSVVAAVAGAVAGVGVGRVIVFATAGLFADGNERFQLDLQFAATRQSLVTGMLIGLVIALLTVWGTSIRIGRLNVIRAIRDLPEPEGSGHRVRSLVLGAVGVVVGGLLVTSGISAGAEIPTLLGPAVALFCLVPLLGGVLPKRLAVSLPCAAAIAWAVFAFSLLPDVFRGADIPLFVLQGVILVGGAVALVSVNTDMLAHLTERLSGSGSGLAARLGVAYPLAKRFRTGLLLGMYALVIFTLTFITVFSQIFREQAPRLTEEVRAGHDLLVDSNPANPVATEALLAQPDVEAAAPLLRATPRFTAPGHPEPMWWAMSGVDERLLARTPPALGTRGAAYATDADAWAAVMADPGLAVISSFFLQESGGPPRGSLRPGEEFTFIHPTTGEERTFTVAGVTSSDWTWNGVMVAAPVVHELLGPLAVPARHYVALRPGADNDAVAARLTGALLENGAEARSFRSMVDASLAQQAGFMRLMQGFLALGLVIGIAGLGVVMVRAVRERRRQIGMLRAMGVGAGAVRSAFLVEAAFIAVQGIVIGVVLGLVTSWSLLSNSGTFGEQSLPFRIPWSGLAVVLVVPLVASLVAAARPAAKAAAIKPAVALRIAD